MVLFVACSRGGERFLLVITHRALFLALSLATYPSGSVLLGGFQAARQTAESRVRMLEDCLKGSGRQQEKTRSAEARAVEEATAIAREKVHAASSVGFLVDLESCLPALPLG